MPPIILQDYSDMVTPLLSSDGESSTNSTSNLRKNCGWIKLRYVVALLSTFGCFCIYSTRTCMSIAIVCMVNHTALNLPSKPEEVLNRSVITGVCLDGEGNDTKEDVRKTLQKEDGTLIWDEYLQGVILSSFFWGYTIPQFCAGFLSDRYGGKRIWGCCLLLSSIFTIMIPLGVQGGSTFVIILRVLCGLCQGVTYPALFSILSRWTPEQERSKLVTISCMGSSIGIMVCFPVSATLCTSSLFGGWPSIFYLFGTLGIIWFPLWMLIVSDYPDNHPWISEEEKSYIANNVKFRYNQNSSIPLTQIMKSRPLLSLCLMELVGSFKFFLFLMQLPTYLKVVMGYNVKDNGFINLVPHIIGMPLGLFFAWFFDKWVSSRISSITTIRKVVVMTGGTIAASCLIGVTFAGCSRETVVTLVCISLVSDSLDAGGAGVNQFDLSPNFVGTLKGITNTFSSIGGILAPYVIGLLIQGNNTITQWNTAFYITSGAILFGALMYVTFGSGEIQPWDTNAAEELTPVCENADGKSIREDL